ncbi:MAG TPA: hypothetical protein VGM03_06310, partial [Phycisphaerae bacterium]
MRKPIVAICLMGYLALSTAQSHAVPITAFTYQGQLKQSGVPLNGTADFRFRLYDASQMGVQIGPQVDQSNLSMSNGMVALPLDFGAGAYTSSNPRWLEIDLRSPAGSGAFTTLVPRQPLTPTPFALNSRGIDVDEGGNVAIGADNPAALLDVHGTARVTSFQLPSGAGEGLVLTSDANGVGSWGALPGLTLPFSGSANLSAAGGCVFTITCTGLAPAICGNNTATSGTTCGVVGTANSPNGRGVCGNGATGVQGTSTTANGTGVAGYASGGSDAWGVSGETVTGQAVIGRAGTAPPGGGFPGGTGVVGFSNVPGAFGMWAQVTDGNAVGLTASNISNTGPGYGLRSFSSSSSNGAASIGGIQVSPTGNTVGVYGEASSNSGWGVYGNATATSGNANGVWGNSVSPNGTGVIGANTASSGLAAGVHGFSSSTTGGAGVVGSNYMPSGTTYGVYGESDSTSGTGVFGNVTAASGYTHGVTGYTSSDYGAGVFGNAWATTGPATGVTGISYSSGGYGVYGLTYDTSGVTYAIYGQSNGNPNGWAGYFSGNVNVTGTLSKGFGTFKIDHPLDPENKYLYHSFVESPDMKNI